MEVLKVMEHHGDSVTQGYSFQTSCQDNTHCTIHDRNVVCNSIPGCLAHWHRDMIGSLAAFDVLD